MPETEKKAFLAIWHHVAQRGVECRNVAGLAGVQFHKQMPSRSRFIYVVRKVLNC